MFFLTKEFFNLFHFHCFRNEFKGKINIRTVENISIAPAEVEKPPLHPLLISQILRLFVISINLIK